MKKMISIKTGKSGDGITFFDNREKKIQWEQIGSGSHIAKLGDITLTVTKIRDSVYWYQVIVKGRISMSGGWETLEEAKEDAYQSYLIEISTP